LSQNTYAPSILFLKYFTPAPIFYGICNHRCAKILESHQCAENDNPIKFSIQVDRSKGHFFADKMITPAFLNGKGRLPLG
jgi:hypothetical protein